MTKVITPEQLKKLKAGAEQYQRVREECRKNGLVVDNYLIYEIDEMNWAVVPPLREEGKKPRIRTKDEEDGCDLHYFPDIRECLRHLIRTLLGKGVKGTPASLLKALDEAEARIMTAHNKHFGEE